METISYENTFEDTVALVDKVITRWFAGSKKHPPDIEQFAEPVYFKSSGGVLIHSNTAYREFFSAGVSPTGRIAVSFLDNSIINISKNTDALILGGAFHVQFDHSCLGPKNKWYLLRSYKQSLAKFNDNAYEILGISRPLSFDREVAEAECPIEERYAIFSRLSVRDKRICVLLAEGRSATDIGKILDVSGKTVDNRRRKILEKFDFDHPIEIVKLLVRLEERGFEV